MFHSTAMNHVRCGEYESNGYRELARTDKDINSTIKCVQAIE